MAQCSICSHPRVREINRRVLTGRQIKETAIEYGINRGTLYSHMRNHLPWRSSRAKAAVTVGEQLADLKVELLRLQILAEAGEDVGKALMVVRQRQSLLELEARMEHLLGATHSKLMPRRMPEGDYKVTFENGRPKTEKLAGEK